MVKVKPNRKKRNAGNKTRVVVLRILKEEMPYLKIGEVIEFYYKNSVFTLKRKK